MGERLKLKYLCYLTLSALMVLCCVGCQHVSHQPVSPAVGSAAGYEQAETADIAKHIATNTYSPYPEIQSYEKDLFTSINQRWFELIDVRSLNTSQIGHVDVRFDLHADGTVTDVEMVTNTMSHVYGTLCVKAVADLAPYPKWSDQMRSRIGQDDNLFSVTFYYEGAAGNKQGMPKGPP
ncbi:MAG TPA: hypothetical protein VH255_02930 [Verrucomicrobiae bacterium]|nr:hypothetical protein [Verrucomicrobiae bacterium]